MLHYRHSDGYPLGLGVELIQSKVDLETVTVLKMLGVERERGSPLGKVEDAFLKVQRDPEKESAHRYFHLSLTNLAKGGSLQTILGVKKMIRSIDIESTTQQRGYD